MLGEGQYETFHVCFESDLLRIDLGKKISDYKPDILALLSVKECSDVNACKLW